MSKPSIDPSILESLRRQEPLARFTAARLGGPADYLYIAKDPTYVDLIALLRWAWRRGMPVTVIGGGANVLVSDKGLRGLTIVNKAARIESLVDTEPTCISVSSGTSLIRLARYCQEQGLSGLEWAIAVPGTVGGAVVNNAGAHAGETAGILKRALLYEAEAGERWVDIDEMEYAYRHSRLKQRTDRRFFILRAEFALAAADDSAIGARMEQYNDYRRRTQPPGASLGSIFKNPPGDFAGRLIEAAGLKGLRVGAVRVSPVHANFFITLGQQASARDYFELIKLVRARVNSTLGVRLELEIQTLGEWQ